MAYDPTSGLWTPDASGNGSATTGASGLTSTNATPTGAPTPPTTPNPTSSVAGNVNNLVSSGSPLMKQAASAGTDVANSRGLQNSSIAAGTAQTAVLAQAVPIASADASIVANKDLATQQIAANKDLSAQGFAQNTALQKQQNDSAMALGQLSQATQLQIANMNVASDQQDKATAAAVSYASIYQSGVNAITSNTAIPAATRDAMLANAQTLLNNGIAATGALYNVNMNWPSPTPDVTSATGNSNSPSGNPSTTAPDTTTTAAAAGQTPDESALQAGVDKGMSLAQLQAAGLVKGAGKKAAALIAARGG